MGHPRKGKWSVDRGQWSAKASGQRKAKSEKREARSKRAGLKAAPTTARREVTRRFYVAGR